MRWQVRRHARPTRPSEGENNYFPSLFILPQSQSLHLLALVLGALYRNDGRGVQILLPVMRRLSLAILALQRPTEHVLLRTLDVLRLADHATVTAHRSLHVELLRALAIGCCASVAPDLLALHRGRWTVALEAVARGLMRGVFMSAGISVLVVHIVRTIAILPRAVLWQVALVRRVPAQLSLRHEL